MMYEITLSVARAESCYGIPVLVIDGVAYAPLDMVKVDGKHVAAACLLWEWVSRFMSQIPPVEGDGEQT